MAIPLLLLNPYVDAVLVIALGICIGGIMNALTPFIEKIPWVGGAIANAVRGMSQAITHACGVILAPISDAVGGTFHAASRLIDWSYAEFRRHSSLLLHTALLASRLALAFHALRALVHSISHGVSAVLPRVKTLEKEYHGIEHRVKTLERDLAQGIGHDLRIHVQALEREVGAIEHKVIPGLRADIQTSEADLTDLENWLGAKVGTSFKTWAEALAITALGALGLGGLNCNSNPFKNNKNACGLWGDLAGLLALGAAADLALHVDEIVKIIEKLTPPAVAVMNKAK